MGKLRRRDWIEIALVVVGLSIILGFGYYYLADRGARLHKAGGTAWAPATFIDDYIPLWPIWVWPYLLYFPVTVAPIVFIGRMDRFRRIWIGYLLTFVPCLLLFLIFPTVIYRPEFEVTGPSTWALNLFYEFDPGYNILPSLHVAAAVFVAWVFQRFGRRWAPWLWGAAAAISISTVFVKQHYFVDVPTGIMMGTAAYFVAFWGYQPPESAPDQAPEPLDS